MKPSPIQLLRLMFKHVKVELEPAHLPEQIPNPLEAVFTFDGVSIRTDVGIGEADPQANGQLYFLELKVVVDNEPHAEAVNQKFAPYKIDIAVEGIVLVPNGAEKLGPPEDLAVVNGTSLLWSAVREQVLSLTARMQAGPVMLPTVHFHDLKSGAKAAAPAAAESEPAATKSR
jgi:hypothetical protein